MKILMKVGPYNMTQDGISKYESVSMLTLQKYDPSIEGEKFNEYLDNIKFDLQNIDRIITSSQKRSIDTAQYFIENGLSKKDVSILNESYLNEIRFDIKKLCSKEEYEVQGSNIVRLRFLEYFIANKLEESHAQIKERFDHFATELEKNKCKNALFISHTFFIKLFLIYHDHPDLFENPEIIKKFINPEKRIMDFLESSIVKQVDPEKNII